MSKNNKNIKIYELATKETRTGAPQTDWHASEPWDEANVNAILDPMGAVKNRRITSYPSPIGQLHFYKDAFEYWAERREEDVNDIYYQAVSDILDIWEIMFNWDQFSTNLDFSIWNTDQIEGLLQSRYKGHKILGNSLKLFLLDPDDPALSEIKRIYLIRYAGKLIAGSSPYTGFFLPPEKTNSNIPIPGSENEFYLSTARPLHTRNPKFKAYLYKLSFVLETQNISSYKVLTNYVTQQRRLDPNGNVLMGDSSNISDIVSDYEEYEDIYNSKNLKINLIDNIHPPLALKKYKLGIEESCGFLIDATYPMDQPVLALKAKPEGPSKEYLPGQKWNPELKISHFPLESDIYNRKLPGTNIVHPWITIGDFLEESIIQVPYPIDENYFFLGTSEKESSFLLPIKPLYFKFFTLEDLQRHLNIKVLKEANRLKVRVELNIPLKNQFSGDNLRFMRDYESGRSIKSSADLRESDDGIGNVIPYDLGLLIFPFLKVQNVDELNDFFKVGLIDGGNDSSNLHPASLEFYREEGRGQAISQSRDLVIEERNALREDESGSIYYEINNKIFDFIQTKAFDADNSLIQGLIIPNWPEKALGQRAIKVSVDLGTTNTNISLRLDKAKPKSLEFEEVDSLIGRLDKISESFLIGKDYTETEKYDTWLGGDVFVHDIIKKQRHEFIPSILGELYSFPLRTALSVKSGVEGNSQGYRVLGNANIAFAFNKRFYEEKNWDIYTNLKWSNKEEGQARLRVFLYQLLYMIRTRIILDNGDPRNTHLFWFYPLSMSNNRRNMLARLWNDGCRNILKTTQISEVPESEAPYYFLEAGGKIKGSTVLLTDIGGGTTDILIISKSEDSPQREIKKSNSFTFAADTVFGCPEVDRENYTAKHNGFTKTFKPIIEKRIRNLIDSAPKANQSRYQELEATLNWYFEGNSMSAEDIISFFFSQKEFEFSKKLEQDYAFKQVFLFFFSALYFHCAQVFKSSDIPPPTDIYFSGNGSKMIRLISFRLSDIATVISEIFKEVLELEKSPNITLHQAEKPKESTSHGILFKQDENKLKINPDSLEKLNKPILGENFSWDSPPKNESITYGMIDKAKFNVEESAYFRFLDLYFDLHQSLRFKQTFDIRISDTHSLKNQLKNRFREKHKNLFDVWINRQSRGGGLDDEIEETIFFLAVKDALQELVNQAAQQHNVTNN